MASSERESAGQIPFNEKVIIYIMKYKPIVSNKYKDEVSINNQKKKEKKSGGTLFNTELFFLIKQTYTH